MMNTSLFIENQEIPYTFILSNSLNVTYLSNNYTHTTPFSGTFTLTPIANSSNEKTFLDHLFDAQIIDQKLFSILLNPYQKFINFGEYDSSMIDGPLVFI